MKTERAYKERFYPTPEQALLLAQPFGCARFVYNNTLKFRTDAYYNDGKSISHSCMPKHPLNQSCVFYEKWADLCCKIKNAFKYLME